MIVLDGQDVESVSYEDMHLYFRNQGSKSAQQDTDQVWWTLVNATRNITPVHLGCGQAYGDCVCQNQVVPRTGSPLYRISMLGIGRAKGEKRAALRALLMEWVIPQPQFSKIARHDITAHLQSFRFKVFDAVQAFVRTAPA